MRFLNADFLLCFVSKPHTSSAENTPPSKPARNPLPIDVTTNGLVTLEAEPRSGILRDTSDGTRDGFTVAGLPEIEQADEPGSLSVQLNINPG